MSADGVAGVALVTGASRGIGKEAARQLGARGYDVLVSARDGKRAAAVAAELAAETERGGTFTPLTLDVADPQSIATASARVRADPGRLDVLVNNAGIGSDFGVSGADPDFDAIQRALDTNFFGAYRVAIALLDLLRASASPRIRSPLRTANASQSLLKYAKTSASARRERIRSAHSRSSVSE